MASQMTFYADFLKFLADGTIDLDADTIKAILVTSSYTPSHAHSVLADVNASPDPEVVAVASPDNGYTTGGETLTGVTWTNTESPAQAKLDANDIDWTALTATFRYLILYASKSVGSPAIVNPLICYILLDTTPADVVVSGVDYQVKWSANGIFTLAQG